jgi:hypothetical protein
MKTKPRETMKTKLLTVLILAAAAQFSAAAAPDATMSVESPVSPQVDPKPFMTPFIVTAHRITPRDLQLIVATEPSVRPFHYHEPEQVLATRFQTDFKAEGFKGNVDLLSSADTPMSTLPLLKIDLTQWSATPGAMTACTFSATLVTPSGTKWLGNFAGVSQTLSGVSGVPTAEARADTLLDAANHAVLEVYQELRATHAL